MKKKTKKSKTFWAARDRCFNDEQLYVYSTEPVKVSGWEFMPAKEDPRFKLVGEVARELLGIKLKPGEEGQYRLVRIK